LEKKLLGEKVHQVSSRLSVIDQVIRARRSYISVVNESSADLAGISCFPA